MLEFRRVFEATVHVYGVHKAWRPLGREGIAVDRCTLAWRMRAMGLQAIVRGRKIPTTIPDAAFACPLDRVNHPFKAPRPRAVWVSDFTDLATPTSRPGPATSHIGHEIFAPTTTSGLQPGLHSALVLRRSCARAHLLDRKLTNCLAQPQHGGYKGGDIDVRERAGSDRPPKEQPPRKLSGPRTARRSTLWKAERPLPPMV